MLWDLAERAGDARPRGLNKLEIDALPTSKFSEKTVPTTSQRNATHGETENAGCRVCLSDFEANDTLRTVPCLHRFHQNCIDEWIKVR